MSKTISIMGEEFKEHLCLPGEQTALEKHQ